MVLHRLHDCLFLFCKTIIYLFCIALIKFVLFPIKHILHILPAYHTVQIAAIGRNAHNLISYFSPSTSKKICFSSSIFSIKTCSQIYFSYLTLPQQNFLPLIWIIYLCIIHNLHVFSPFHMLFFLHSIITEFSKK